MPTFTANPSVSWVNIASRTSLVTPSDSGYEKARPCGGHILFAELAGDNRKKRTTTSAWRTTKRDRLFFSPTLHKHSTVF